MESFKKKVEQFSNMKSDATRLVKQINPILKKYGIVVRGSGKADRVKGKNLKDRFGNTSFSIPMSQFLLLLQKRPWDDSKVEKMSWGSSTGYMSALNSLSRRIKPEDVKTFRSIIRG
jgi:hypothetical protein